MPTSRHREQFLHKFFDLIMHDQGTACCQEGQRIEFWEVMQKVEPGEMAGPRLWVLKDATWVPGQGV